MSDTTPTSPYDATPAAEHATEQAAPVDAETRLSPVVAAEVAKELSSLARTMFELTLLEADVLAPEQLDPQAGQGASPVVAPETSPADTQPVEPPTSSPTTPAAGPVAPSPDAVPASIALPDVPPLEEADATPAAPEATPAAEVPAAIPVPELDETPAPAAAAAEPPAPAKPRTMALLDEISFLDE